MHGEREFSQAMLVPTTRPCTAMSSRVAPRRTTNCWTTVWRYDAVRTPRYSGRRHRPSGADHTVRGARQAITDQDTRRIGRRNAFRGVRR